MRRLFLCLTLPAVLVLLLPVRLLSLESPPDQLVILCDASYSMGLRIHNGGKTALELLTAAALSYIEQLPTQTPVAILVTEHAGQTEIALSYTTDRALLRRTLEGVSPWGSTALQPAIERGLALAAAPDGTAELLLLTDGVDADTVIRGHSGVSIAVPSGVRFSALTVPATASVGVHQDLATAATRSGGTSRLVLEPPTHSRPPAEPAMDGASVPDHASHEARPPAEQPVYSARGLQPTAFWTSLALLTVLLGAVGAWWASRELAWLRRARRIRSHNAIPPVAVFDVVISGGGRTNIIIRQFPASLGTEPECTHTVPAAPGRGSFVVEIDRQEERVRISSRDELKVHGRQAREAILQRGDQVRLGGYTIYFEGVMAVRRWRITRRTHTPLLAPVGVLAVGIGALVAFGRPAQSPTPPTEAGAPAQERTDAVEPADHTPEPQAAAMAQLPATTWSPATPRVFAGADLVVHAPGEPVSYFKADYLIIHAHPDDEALDFGAYAARAAERGERGVVVLMTDGNSGLDQYPYRPVDALHPAYDLRGAALSRVRVVEASDAIRILGARSYVRLGHTNAPYNGLLDEQTVSQVLQRWGGTEQVVGQLMELIRGFRPTVLLSPDAPRTTREHFEHETTGYAVWEAVRRLDTEGAAPPIHLVAIDPLQRSEYGAYLAHPVIDAAVRTRHVAALAAHLTQRDATIIGIETRLAVGYEFYGVARWDPARPLPADFALWGRHLPARATHPGQIALPRPVGKYALHAVGPRSAAPVEKGVTQVVSDKKEAK